MGYDDATKAIGVNPFLVMDTLQNKIRDSYGVSTLLPQPGILVNGYPSVSFMA